MALFTAGLFLIGIGALYVQRDTEERQLRAYVVLTDFGVFCIECGDTVLHDVALLGIKNSIRYRIENNGQTPASKVTSVTSWWPVAGSDAKLPANFGFPDHPIEGRISQSDIGRDKTKDTASGIDDADIGTFKAAGDRRSTLFIYGHVDYCDVFGHPHTTAYCFIYARNGGTHLPICESYNGEIPAMGKC